MSAVLSRDQQRMPPLMAAFCDLAKARDERNAAFRDLGTPEETEARLQRIEAARAAKLERARELSNARAAIRKYGVRTPHELLAFMVCIQGAVPSPAVDDALGEFSARLQELCTELDEALFDADGVRA